MGNLLSRRRALMAADNGGIVKNGLVVHYDALENLRLYGKVNKFVNLTGNTDYDGAITGYNAANWKNNAYTFNVTTRIELPIILTNTSDFTVEGVVSVSKTLAQSPVNSLVTNYKKIDDAFVNYRCNFLCYHYNAGGAPQGQVATLKSYGGEALYFLHTGIAPAVNQVYAASTKNASKKGTIYFNGEKKEENSGFYNTPIANVPLTIGNPSTVSTAYFIGDLYSFRLYGRALSDAEIARNFENDKRRYDVL
jgi:hypothetical protein